MVDFIINMFSLEDILSADRQLAREIEFDLKKFERDEEEGIVKQNIIFS